MPDTTKPKAKKTISPEHLEKMRQGRLRKAAERKAAKEKAKAEEEEKQEQAKKMVEDQRKVKANNAKAMAKQKMRAEIEKLKSQVHFAPEPEEEEEILPEPPSAAAAAAEDPVPEELKPEPAPEPEPEREPEPEPEQDNTAQLQAQIAQLQQKLAKRAQDEEYGVYRKMCDKIAKTLNGEDRTQFHQMTAEYDHTISAQENVNRLLQTHLANEKRQKEITARQIIADKEQQSKAKALAEKKQRMRKVFSMY
jgi:hypothetical protein